MSVSETVRSANQPYPEAATGRLPHHPTALPPALDPASPSDTGQESVDQARGLRLEAGGKPSRRAATLAERAPRLVVHVRQDPRAVGLAPPADSCVAPCGLLALSREHVCGLARPAVRHQPLHAVGRDELTSAIEEEEEVTADPAGHGRLAEPWIVRTSRLASGPLDRTETTPDRRRRRARLPCVPSLCEADGSTRGGPLPRRRAGSGIHGTRRVHPAARCPCGRTPPASPFRSRSSGTPNDLQTESRRRTRRASRPRERDEHPGDGRPSSPGAHPSTSPARQRSWDRRPSQGCLFRIRQGNG